MNKLTTLIIGIFAIFFITKANALDNISSKKPAHINFETLSYDFKTIEQNDNGSHSFKFTNTGKEPLIIENVQTSCGCTIASKPSEPILPGESSEILVKYDTRRIGNFTKNITVTSNADNASIVLSIKGEVQAVAKEELPVKSVNEGYTPVAK